MKSIYITKNWNAKFCILIYQNAKFSIPFIKLTIFANKIFYSS